MKITDSTRTIVAILAVVALAILFWVALLSPKREEASKLSAEAEGVQATLAQSQQKVAEAEAARREFPKNYNQLVVLGQAVPAGDETASLLVELNRIAQRSDVRFESITLGTADGSASTEPEAAAAPVEGAPAAATATEAEAALLPIGATVGGAGLGVMPYDLSFTGSFFDVADFIEGIDSLLHTKDGKVTVDGRLVTLDGFSLVENEKGFPYLDANFSVTTYVVPPDQGITAGATSTGPAESTEVGTEEAAPEEATTEEGTTEGTPSSSTEEAR
jgi:Tfp pilus assembly protein PilO